MLDLTAHCVLLYHSDGKELEDQDQEAPWIGSSLEELLRKTRKLEVETRVNWIQQFY